MPWTKVTVSQSAFRGFPQHCASCLSVENLEFLPAEAKGFFQDRVPFDVPICATCAKRDRWLSKAGFLLLALSAIAERRIAGHFDLTLWTRDAIVIVTVVLASWVSHRKTPVAVSKKSGQDSVVFWMRNLEFAREFAAMNAVTYEEAAFAPVL